MPDQIADEAVHPGGLEAPKAEHSAERTLEDVAVGDHLMVVEAMIQPGDERGRLFLLRKIATSGHNRSVPGRAVEQGERTTDAVLGAFCTEGTTLTPEEAVMSADIDRIIALLGDGIPKLHKQLDEIRARLRRPIAL